MTKRKLERQESARTTRFRVAAARTSLEHERRERGSFKSGLTVVLGALEVHLPDEEGAVEGAVTGASAPRATV